MMTAIRQFGRLGHGSVAGLCDTHRFGSDENNDLSSELIVANYGTYEEQAQLAGPRYKDSKSCEGAARTIIPRRWEETRREQGCTNHDKAVLDAVNQSTTGMHGCCLTLVG